MLSHGPIVWAVELVAISLDTGKEVDRFKLNSSMDYGSVLDYVIRLKGFTGFEMYEDVT